MPTAPAAERQPVAQVPRPLLGVLLVTVGVAVGWFAVLGSHRPSGASSASGATNTGRPAAVAPARPIHAPAAPHHHLDGAPRHRLDAVTAALHAHKVLALLFYNPAGADDAAVKHELWAVPTHGGLVVKLAVPVHELARYPVITTQVPVTQSPTLVVVDGRRQASALVGFAGGFEIGQRVAAALAAK